MILAHTTIVMENCYDSNAEYLPIVYHSWFLLLHYSVNFRLYTVRQNRGFWGIVLAIYMYLLIEINTPYRKHALQYNKQPVPIININTPYSKHKRST